MRPKSVSALPTPAALVDAVVVRANVARMAELAKRLGVRLRPHVKTHKCVEAARLQEEAGGPGITVSTLAEARFFASHGFRDITYAVPIAPNRAVEAAELAVQIDRLNLLVDHADTLDAVERAARVVGRRLPVFLKVDCGYHRAGVSPFAAASVAFAARMAESPDIDFQGVLTHAGHAYACRTRGEIQDVARQERDITVEFAARLRAAGIDVREVSIGSTPTMSVVDHLEGVTEIRPGNYIFYDAFQAMMGSCSWQDTAFTVLTTVVGSYPDRRVLIVDAGALALSKDLGARQIDPDAGYGVVQSADRTRTFANVHIHALSQEHGHMHIEAEGPFPAFRIGDKLRIIPNHSCLSAALFERYHVVQDGVVTGEWKPVRGW